jgi:riboflavin kinase/FMN adenylyltransferase
MELLRGLAGLRPRHRPSVATIGAFDGGHLGHQAVIAQLLEQGRLHDLPTTVVVFEPLPREYLSPQSAPSRLQSLRGKFEALSSLGVDLLLCLPFNEALRSMSAEAFVRSVFVEGLAIRALVIGDDFRFGKEREGDAELINEIGAREGFSALPTDSVELDGERVSSTRLRATLADGDLELASRLLGRSYAMVGRVVYGRQLGRTIGAPTANISLRLRKAALTGVFAVSVSGAGLHGAPAIANVGTRPTIAAGQRANLEVHLLDGSPDLYGERLTVSFLHKLRDEQRFDSIEQLSARIAADIDSAKLWFSARAKDE